MSDTGHRPHPYGNCDACGDPTRLLTALAEEGERLGINLEAEPVNSWDATLPLGARGMARLILALRQVATPPGEQETVDLLLTLVDGIDSIGG